MRTHRVSMFGAVVAAMVLIGIVGCSKEEASPPKAVSTSDAGAPAALPEFTDTDDDPAVGQAVPMIEMKDLEGKAFEIGAKGPMVYVLVAHWCPHCQAEVPRIVEAASGSAEIEGVPFVAIATANDEGRDNFPASDWLEREKWPAPVIVDSDNSEVAAAFGLKGFPFLVAVGADGKVVARTSGERSIEELKEFFALASD